MGITRTQQYDHVPVRWSIPPWGRDLDVPAVEAIAVTQAIERIIAVVKDYDRTLDDITFDVDIHDRAIEQAPYRRIDE